MSDLQLPDSVRLVPGPGDPPVVRVDGPDGWAEIHLHGAHVTAWGPTGEPSALWLSPLSRFDGATAIRGGVPLCFPWFGPLAGRPDAPRHGLGRTALWTLDEARQDGRDVVVRLRMADDESTRASVWPHPFTARCTVVVGARLTVTLEFTHLGAEPVVLEEALHTYLAVADVATAEIRGLEDAAFVDKTADAATVPAAGVPMRIAGEVDRVYLATSSAVSVHDAAGGRTLTVAKAGSATTVVWNPWADGARATADIDDEGWARFVCVEACNVGAAAVALAAGGSHEISTTIATGPVPPPATATGRA